VNGDSDKWINIQKKYINTLKIPTTPLKLINQDDSLYRHRRIRQGTPKSFRAAHGIASIGGVAPPLFSEART